VALATANSFVVRYENDPTDTPTDEIWMEVKVDFGNSNQITIGVKQFRNPGILTVMIKSKTGKGSAPALAVADTIVDWFRANIISQVHFQTPRIEKVGRVDDDYQVNVICPFFADEN
jgi:hypothetical protein